LIRLNFVFDKALVYTPIAVVPFSLVATFKRRVVSIVYLTGLGILGKFPFKFFLIYVKLIASKFIVQNNEDYSFLKSLGCSVVNLGCTGCALPDFEKDYHTSDIINVLYLGRIINAKGNKILFDLIDFYGSCDSKLVFHVAGYSTKEVHARLIELQTRFPNNLRFYGLIRDEERITRLLKFCDVLIYPTVFNEGVPRSIQEAMSFGLPVISNQNRGVDELFIPNYNMLYANYNFPSYKQVLDDFSKLEFRHRRILGQRNRLMASLFCVSKKQSELLFHVTMS
jgi:glycosyltransferase involved in cell wall biosynthesis